MLGQRFEKVETCGKNDLELKLRKDGMWGGKKVEIMKAWKVNVCVDFHVLCLLKLS